MNHAYYTPSDLSSESPILTTPPVDGGDPASVRRHFSRLGLAYLAMTVSFMAVAYAVQLAAFLFFPSLYDTWWFSWVVSVVPLYCVGLPVLWLLLRRLPTAPHQTLCTVGGLPAIKPPFRAAQWFTLLIMAFGGMTAGSLVGSFIMAALTALTGYDYAFALNSMVNSTPVWFTTVCACILVPLGEELLFRKLLIDRTRRYGDFPSILLSGILFGLFHGNLFQFFYAAAVGMLLAYIYTRTGKYLLCVAMHAVINLMGSVVTPALSRLTGALAESSPNGALTDLLTSGTLLLAMFATLLLLTWQYGTLIAGICLFCGNFRRRALSAGEIPLKKRASLPWLNPGMIACLVVMLALVVVSLIPAG